MTRSAPTSARWSSRRRSPSDDSSTGDWRSCGPLRFDDAAGRVALYHFRSSETRSSGIHGDRAVARGPMEVRAGHPSGRSDKSDLLSPHDRVADRHERLAEVEVRGDDSAAVVNVNDVAGEKEVVDERDDAAVRRAHRLSDRATKIDAEVTAGHAAVEDASGPELARDYQCRADEGRKPSTSAANRARACRRLCARRFSRATRAAVAESRGRLKLLSTASGWATGGGSFGSVSRVRTVSVLPEICGR